MNGEESGRMLDIRAEKDRTMTNKEIRKTNNAKHFHR